MFQNEKKNWILIDFENAEYRIFLTNDTLTCCLLTYIKHTTAHCKNRVVQNTIMLDNWDENIISYSESHIKIMKANVKF